MTEFSCKQPYFPDKKKNQSRWLQLELATSIDQNKRYSLENKWDLHNTFFQVKEQPTSFIPQKIHLQDIPNSFPKNR